MKKGKEMAQANYSPLRVASASAGCVVLEDERSYFALRGVNKGFHIISKRRRPQKTKIGHNPRIRIRKCPPKSQAPPVPHEEDTISDPRSCP